MALSKEILAEIDETFDKIWRVILDTINPNSRPFIAEVNERGFKASNTPLEGYELLPETDHKLFWAYRNANKCDLAAYVLCPLAKKLFADEAAGVLIALLDMDPPFLIEVPNSAQSPRDRLHTIILVTDGDGGQRIIDVTRAQFGVAERGLALRDYVDRYSLPIEPTPLNLMTYTEYRRLLFRGTEDGPNAEIKRHGLARYKLLRRHVNKAYRDWAQEMAQDSQSPLYVCGAGPSDAKNKLLKAVENAVTSAVVADKMVKEL